MSSREEPLDPAEVTVERLEQAARDGEIRPWYQPIVRLGSAELVGFEALARWHLPSGQVELPAAFLGLAEESGLVTFLDMALMEHSTRDLARWQAVRPGLRLSLNFSGRHLADPTWADRVHEVALAAGVPPEQLDLELTETSRPADLARGAGLVQSLRERGYHVWFDDFGTGWSELQQLVELPVDGVKIDRFFATTRTPRADAVLRGLLSVAAELGLGTVVEGIGTEEEAARALALGCDLAQGYLWSRAMPTADVDALIASTDGRITAAAR